MYFIYALIVVIYNIKVSLFLFNIVNKSCLYSIYNYYLKIIEINCLFICNIGFKINALIYIIVFLFIVDIHNIIQVFTNFININCINNS